MAPFAKGFVRPRSRKMRALISVGESVAPPDPRRRPLPSLLDPPPFAAPLKKGIPQLELQFDTLNTIVTGFRKYQPPPEKLPPLRREYTEKNFNELFAKCRFELHGSFPYNGDKLRDEILRIAKDLHIVGWVKCRSNFASGHLQGDTFALSYFRRWLDRHAPYAIDSTNFFDEAIGLQALDYQQIAAVNDYRSPAKKKLHMLMAAEKQKALKLERDSQQRAAAYQRYIDECCVRNY
ncbi:uncharacterized protein LOC34619648 [Cyclospora cayetanensis]|uniref:Uncharacterized protein LOC34619648 n=1 Tax=Cyclospora cayetanensis TaxID=88456 RepID=A0A6P6S3A6_9EIME|nr:uncharacterized protein LOC34619648 [Cyclospora cayetanensis]